MAPSGPPRRIRTLHGGVGKGKKVQSIEASTLRAGEATSQDERYEAVRLANAIDESLGFPRFESGPARTGWLCNMHSTTIEDDKIPGGRAGVDFYFIDEAGDTFKATVVYDPYFLIAVKHGKEADVEEWCRRNFEGLVKSYQRLEKEDLQMPNHLLGYRRTLLKLSFANVNDLLNVRKTLLPLAEANKSKMDEMDTYAEVATATMGVDMFDEEDIHRRQGNTLDASDSIVDIREYDVPYHVRVAIDLDIRIGKWYSVQAKHGKISLSCFEDRLQRADPVVMAFDIETTKLPLKFPDAAIDQVMMISYMVDGQGCLITNREIVSEDISDFDYTPKTEYPGPFTIFNEPNEKMVLERFFEHIKEARPTVISTYNGDFFDWPFIETRASIHGIDMYQEIGFRKNSEDIYRSDHCAHMDAFAWVNRDSYLPQGSRGLKAVTVAKLGYDPDELDPELMTPYASERPQVLAEYSVSDAVATYYLYMKYVHPFIFSLCTIVPLGPDDTLRKGTGTLCEMLLMVQAYQKNILLPNKHKPPREEFWNGHLLESETYVGGHVESIEAGIFRSDIPCKFTIDTEAIDDLLRDLDAALKFCITVEEKKSLDQVTNFDEVKSQIERKLLDLRDTPSRDECPLIYHLDVASMYPNIMTTNRLQPDSMVKESDCAACDFNRPGKTCDRRLPWSWRGEYLPAKKDEYKMIRHALENERFPGRFPNSPLRTFQDLSLDDQVGMTKKRLQDYSKKVYHKIHDATTLEREAIVCQRENPFYVDTVKNFRDRRYDFKGQQKVWKGKTDALKASGASQADVEEAKKMIILFDSLQLAHKVILNSFYGYVMRKGSRWFSMEMAGVTCLTGAHIIQMARQLVERIGRPLELDTDGIWCILPATFPEQFSFKLANGKSMSISYPCVMLNHLVHAQFTNHQYQTLVDDATFRYETHSDNTIFFEVDGPYKAMILPTSKEEDKNLKKRYAVFNHDGTLAELKGFEVKRRGELKLIKIFQTQIFKFFLEGTTLAETYASVASIANRWLDVLYERGAGLADEELIDLICENKSMAKTLEEYGAQKSTAITTAKRLAEFLGEQMIKDKGLNCKYIISSRPRGAPVTERAIPVAIFSSEERVKRHYLRKWMKEDPGDMDPRTVLDWNYYLERLASVIQKLITIPAALQKVRNPVPRVPHPDWLDKRIRSKDDVFQQKKMTDMFGKRTLSSVEPNILPNRVADLEDFGAAKILTQGFATKMQSKRKAEEATATATAATPFGLLSQAMPLPDEDYVAFIRYQRQKWKIQRQARERRRQLFGEKRPDGSDGIGNLFRNQAEMLYTREWQILQLTESIIPGQVRAFVLIDKVIHALKIVVPRRLYLNLKGEDLPNIDIEDCKVAKVTHTLPNGHASVHLFELEMAESVFLRESIKVSALLHHPSVEGVYESRLPLKTRAMLELGNNCTFDESQQGVLGKGLETGFDLKTLKHVSSAKPYLQNAGMSYLYLYHVTAGDRQVFAIFSSPSNDAHVIVIGRSREQVNLPHLDRIYRDIFAERVESLGDDWAPRLSYEAELQFHVVPVPSRRRAILVVADTLKKLRKDIVGSALAIVQSQDSVALMRDIPMLKDMPHLTMRTDGTDAQFPSLGWEGYISKRLVCCWLEVDAWVRQCEELARYGNVPLCNLEKDDATFLIDVAYARRLQKEKVVLWWSPGPRPDHAGYERDDILNSMETVDMPPINVSGTYSTVCIDIDVKNLLVNTILTSSLIDDFDGNDSFSYIPSEKDIASTDSDLVLHGENTFISTGIKILRDMVKLWHTEACSGNVMADVMVQHLIRWIESPSSFLYDQSLHFYVQTMAKKAFMQLVTDCRRVGSHVVFANQNRLLLQTTKSEVGNAYAYTQYILKTIKAKSMFLFLDLDIREYWDYLIWYDEFNYGGKGCDESVAASLDPLLGLSTIMHWQFQDFLAKTMQTIFHDRVVDFIELMHERKRPQLAIDGTPRPTQMPLQNLTEASDSKPTTFLKERFSMPLQKQILALVRRQRQEMLHHEFTSDWTTPTLPGSRPDTAVADNAVLALVKTVMQVLSLDKSLNLEVRLLRKDLLSLFEIREFAANAQFVNPSASLVVRQISCGECGSLRDLDLCREPNGIDPAVTFDAIAMEQGQTPTFTCALCDSPYNLLGIQERLVADLQKMVLQWSTQDLKCARCARPRVNEFMEHCSCAGEWTGTLKWEDVGQKLGVMKHVSKCFSMGMVSAAVAELYEG